MTGKELKRLRTQMQFTQKQLAEKLGVTENTVAQWERGEVPINEPAARLLRGGQMSETMAELYEREFPTPVGKKLAALTRKSEEVARRIDELNEKIQSEPLDSKRFRGLVRKFLSAANEHMRAVNQIEHELDRLGAAALR
ncbi:MAG: hypothetical protein DMG86_22105 [Acidobacteria bacterium]|nr:MAG: hypothetical protein DMG86_22105 [Acidobacteriota bacterium]